MQRPSLLARSAFRFAALCLAIACSSQATTPWDDASTLFVTVSTGTIHTCGLIPAGMAYCWGSNGGALGDGTTTERLTPMAVVMPAGVTFTSVSAGGGHSCGLTPAGAAYCWGYNVDGQVGDGTTTDRLTPMAVVLPTGLSFASIGGGEYHTCGLTPAGAGHCWGDNQYGQLGDGTTTDRLTPTAVAVPAGVTFTSLAVGWVHSCGLTPAGVAYCWGNNADGEVGDGTTTDRLTPTAVAIPGGVTFTSLAVGIIHTCGLTPEGATYCWGANHRGRLGDGTTTNRLTPVAVAMPAGVTFTSVSAGYAHTCGLTPAGGVYCWGRNVFGELGDGTTTNRLTPTAGAAYCWGVNGGGRLGDGTTTNRLTPVKVVQP